MAARARPLPDRNSERELGHPAAPEPKQQLRPTTLRTLREPVASFVGRSAELERLGRLLRSTTGAAVVLSGARSIGGIGKTELALRVAAELPGPYPIQLFVDLRGQSEGPLRPEQALEQLIRSLVGQESRLPTDLEALTALYRSLLSGQRALVIADDARDGAQVRPLLLPPGCALLVTSRAGFTLQGAASQHAIELDGLSSADSVKLLQKLSGRLSSQQAAELALRGNHVPLALQLLGNLLRVDPTHHYHELLTHYLSERDRLEQQRPGEGTLLDVQAAVATSFRSVDPWCRSALGQLALVNGAIPRETALALVALPEHASAVAEVLQRLQRSWLLGHDAPSDSFRLHNLVRGFALGQRDPGLDKEARGRLARHVVQVLRGLEKCSQDGRAGELVALQSFERLRLPIEVAKEWAADRAPHDDEAAARAIELGLTASALSAQRLPARLRVRWLEAAVAAARRLGDAGSEARLLGQLGLGYRDAGQLPHALKVYDQQLQLLRPSGDPLSLARAESSVGTIYLELGQAERAIAHFEAALHGCKALHDRRRIEVLLGQLGLCYLELKRPIEAINHFEQQLAAARALGNQRSEGRALGNLGLAQRLSGSALRALDCYDQHLKIARIVGDRRGEGNSSWNRALALESLGRHADAILAAEQSLRIREETADGRADKVRAALVEWKRRLADPATGDS